jgi:hypothetical protein
VFVVIKTKVPDSIRLTFEAGRLKWNNQRTDFDPSILYTGEQNGCSLIHGPPIRVCERRRTFVIAACEENTIGMLEFSIVVTRG